MVNNTVFLRGPFECSAKRYSADFSSLYKRDFGFKKVARLAHFNAYIHWGII